MFNTLHKEEIEPVTKEKEELLSEKVTSNIKEKLVKSTKSPQWERLTLEEQAIVNILLQNEGTVLQKNLSKLSDYSKSTITRIITRLEEQDLIYRTPAGRGYQVFLKESTEKEFG